MKTVTFDETKWKLAPVEPTQEMIDAMPPVEEIGYWAMYSAALDAAPAAPPQPVTLTVRTLKGCGHGVLFTDYCRDCEIVGLQEQYKNAIRTVQSVRDRLRVLGQPMPGQTS